MDTHEILEKLQAIINRIVLSEAQLHLEQDLYKELKADSLSVVEIVMACEEEFQIMFEDEDAQKINTVNDLINIIQSKLAS